MYFLSGEARPAATVLVSPSVIQPTSILRRRIVFTLRWPRTKSYSRISTTLKGVVNKVTTGDYIMIVLSSFSKRRLPIVELPGYHWVCIQFTFSS